MRRELEILDTISHPHIVKIMQLLEGEKFIYIVMEHIDGGNLKELMLREKGLDEQTSRYILL